MSQPPLFRGENVSFRECKPFLGDENVTKNPSNLVGWEPGDATSKAWRCSESETHAAGRRWIGGWKKLVGERLVTVNGKKKLKENSIRFL